MDTQKIFIVLILILLFIYAMLMSCVCNCGDTKDTYSIHKTAVYGEQQFNNQLDSIRATQWEEQMIFNGTPVP